MINPVKHKSVGGGNKFAAVTRLKFLAMKVGDNSIQFIFVLILMFHAKSQGAAGAAALAF